MNAVVEHLKKIYEEDSKQFSLLLDKVEEEIDDKDREFYEAVRKDAEVLKDPLLPKHVLEIVYIGLLHKYMYGNIPHTEIPNAPQVVEVEEERKGKVTINYDALTTYLIKRFAIITYNKVIYVYENGRYVEDIGLIGKITEKILLKQGIADKRKVREIVNEVTARIMWRTSFRHYPFNYLGSKFISVKNGVLYRGDDGYVLLPDSPGFAFTYKLPVKYDPNAKCPKIEKFINEVVDPENVPILYEIPALCLMQSENIPYAYMLVGSGSNGKSTYLNLLQAFLGKENVSNVSLQELCEDRFKIAQLVGKLANIYADLPKNPLRYTGKFKLLTGGDRITIERKFKDPFEFVNKARLIFSANELPEVNDNTYAFWRRWILVEFPKQFPPNPNLIKELTDEEELSGFLNKVLEAMTRIEVRGDVTKNDKVEKLMEEWKKRANSVYAFVQDCIERDPNSYETKEDTYNYYVMYCEMNDLNPLPKNKFSQELQRFVPVRTGRVKIAGQRVYVWYGIKIKKELFEEEEEKDEESFEFEDHVFFIS